MNIEKYTAELHRYLMQLGDPHIAKEQSAYMRNRFPFMGIKRPLLNESIAKYYREHGNVASEKIIPFAKACMQYPEREIWYIGIEVLRKKAKHLEAKHIHDLKDLIIRGDWWDSTDGIATQVVTTLVTKYPSLQEELDRWIEDENMWIRRTAIIYQLKLKKKTDWTRLQTYILNCASEKEFFIQKAIGWALREYSKTNPDEVIRFIDNNDLAPLSKREGLRLLKKNGIVS